MEEALFLAGSFNNLCVTLMAENIFLEFVNISKLFNNIKLCFKSKIIYKKKIVAKQQPHTQLTQAIF